MWLQTLFISLKNIFKTTLIILYWLLAITFVPIFCYFTLLINQDERFIDFIGGKDVFVPLLFFGILFFIIPTMYAIFIGIKITVEFLGQKASNIILNTAWAYKLQKFYFNRVLAKRISNIEPGLTNQKAGYFPHQVVYKDESFRTKENILLYIGNWKRYTSLPFEFYIYFWFICFFLVLVVLLLGFIVFAFISVLWGVNSPFIDLDPNYVIEIFLAIYLISIMAWQLTGYISYSHPKGLVYLRVQALQGELNELYSDEALMQKTSELREKMAEIVQDFSLLDADLENRIFEIKKALTDKIDQLNGVRKSSLLTSENVEVMKNLIETKPDAVMGIVSWAQELLQKDIDRLRQELLDAQKNQEKQERKKLLEGFWFGTVLAGIVVGVLTSFVFEFLKSMR